ncbi:MAG TPA: hypothetical protein VE132_06290, partial [Micromonosporaceae bacterium]|nr:hypothetical protein [Micromonosporaceae bacterium]
RAMVGEIRGETPPPAPSSAGRRTFAPGRAASSGSDAVADDAVADDVVADDVVADGEALDDVTPTADAS